MRLQCFGNIVGNPQSKAKTILRKLQKNEKKWRRLCSYLIRSNIRFQKNTCAITGTHHRGWALLSNSCRVHSYYITLGGLCQ